MVIWFSDKSTKIIGREKDGLSLFFIIFIEVLLIYNIVLLSGVHCNDSVI